ncbi:MAG: hypothetical protein R3Y18_02265 [Bacillota bacterium]
MRAYLFSNKNEKAVGIAGTPASLWFCDMQKCGGVVDFNLPSVLQYFCGSGQGQAFFGENGDVFLQNAVAILGDGHLSGDDFGSGDFGCGEVCLYQKPESEICVLREEFVSGVVHVACCYRHFVVVACGGESFEVSGFNFKSCDCVNENGNDYIFLQFENRLVCIVKSGEGYAEFFNIPGACYHPENGVCKVCFTPKISAGARLYCEISLCGTPPDMENFKFSKLEIKNPDNFNFLTFENYFFELLLVARLLKPTLAQKLISPYLADELKSEIFGILEFLGEFCGIVPCENGGVILIYQRGENIFETRMFEMEISYNKNGTPEVENISEVENFQLDCESFEDLSKILISV